ncbi:MAG: hypothetical protein KatS3mg128_0579 [Silanimonas sp.]|nr:MAG: hypothetical protein KatS3mg128_0579 [Silanimonas sp.]
MIADPRFTGQPGTFWALVRTLSEAIGYTHRTPKGQKKGSGALKVHTIADQAKALIKLGLDPGLVVGEDGEATDLGRMLEDYFQYRAEVLTKHVEPNLMDMVQAKAMFEKMRRQFKPKCPLPLNKQKGEKKEPAYLTGIINMLIERAIAGAPCNYSPGQLTTFTRDGVPLRTLSRRVDGAFPSAVNPIAVWEFKEYYFTTSFGSRVADGVYETLLDGLELQELHTATGVRVEHVLFVDAHYTWWVCGKSYLCRMVDMLNMGLVSEVVFGREAIDRVPVLAARWLQELKARA